MTKFEQAVVQFLGGRATSEDLEESLADDPLQDYEFVITTLTNLVGSD